jgi:hypothetical protein
MSKMAAIDVAVRLQIESDSKAIKYTEPMSKGYVTEEAMERFLLGVANRLKLDTPSYAFDWSTIDGNKAKEKTRLITLSLIEERTKGPSDAKSEAK